ncbi:MAG: DUF3307 domain-containing protein [Candidatus Zixiibacteriota bacterium]
MPDLLLFLLLGHYFGDFALQSDNMARLKPTCVKTLTMHVLIYTLSIAACLYAGLILSGSSAFFTSITGAALAFIFVEHWTQDFIKGRRYGKGNQSFYLDQGLNVLVLFAVRLIAYHG